MSTADEKDESCSLHITIDKMREQVILDLHWLNPRIRPDLARI